MTDEKPQKLSIGFRGGQVLAARASAAEVEQLRSKLGSEGWHPLEAEDGTILLDLARIDYALFERDDHRVGF